MTNLIDKQLGGKYQIQSEIGRGGMGIVYRAFDQNLRRVVAVKVLAPQLAVDPEFVQRFRHEAIAAASLRHHNIVTIHDVGADNIDDWPGRTVHYIVMEHVAGVTLDQWLVRRRGPAPLADTDRVLQQVGSALQFAHDRGVIHRDIKPSNVMLDDEGQVKLMDFGLVRAGELSHLTRSGTVLGTPQYMAPEQIVGGQVDRRTDIYSLGVVIYELLAGEVPFMRPTPMATAYAHVNETPPPLRQRQAITPKPVEAVVMKALAKEPGERYQTAAALAKDFSVAASGVMPAGLAEYDPAKAALAAAPLLGSEKPPATPPPPPAPERSRRTGLVLAAVAALLILLIGGAALMLNGRDDAGGPAAQPPTPPSTGQAVAVADSAATPSPVAADQSAPSPATLAPKSGDSAATTESAAASNPPQSPPVAGAISSPTAEPAPPTVAPTSTPVATRGGAAPTKPPAPTSTPVATATLAAKIVAEPSPTATATRRPTPRPVLTPCPPYLYKPKPGMGLLVIENHLGEGLHIDWPATQQRWDMAPKQGDVPSRLVLDMPPGRHDLNDNTGRGGYGHIGITVEAGQAYVSPIWYNDRAEELVYPLEIPNGCR